MNSKIKKQWAKQIEAVAKQYISGKSEMMIFKGNDMYYVSNKQYAYGVPKSVFPFDLEKLAERGIKIINNATIIENEMGIDDNTLHTTTTLKIQGKETYVKVQNNDGSLTWWLNKKYIDIFESGRAMTAKGCIAGDRTHCIDAVYFWEYGKVIGIILPCKISE